jgi:hypothetical protein
MLLKVIVIFFALLSIKDAFSAELAEPLVQIGDLKKDVRRLYGKPEKSGKQFDSYVSLGLIFTYSEKNKIIVIEGTKMQIGTFYKGTIHGVMINETLEVAENSWGPLVLSKSENCYFKPAGYLLTVGFVGSNQNDDFFSNTIESIEIRKFDDSIVGIWTDKNEKEFIKINDDNSTSLCKLSKKLGVITSEGAISTNGMLEWGKWFSTKSLKNYVDPGVDFSSNHLYIADNEILIGWMTDLKTYHKPSAIPKDCPFGL